MTARALSKLKDLRCIQFRCSAGECRRCPPFQPFLRFGKSPAASSQILPTTPACNVASMASIAAFGRKFPYVSALTGMGYVFTSATWRTRLLRAILKWLLPSLLNRPGDVVLVQNPDDREALVDLGISMARIALIPGSGVDTDALQPLPEPDGPITYGFAGRLLTDKGIRALVAAHDIVRAQGLQTDLLIAGNPDPANPASVSAARGERMDKACQASPGSDTSRTSHPCGSDVISRSCRRTARACPEV